MAKITDYIIPCNCARWETCCYKNSCDWNGNRYAICGYMLKTGHQRNCDVANCNKYKSEE